MFKELINILNEKNFTIGSVESLTAGLFCASIASCPGASTVLRGGLVTYSSDLKTKLADVDKKEIEKHGVVSASVAELMAKGGQKKLETNVCVSFTGNAGPSVLENKKIGEVFIGFAINDTIMVEHKIFSGNRNEIREKACQFAAEKLIKILSE